jgi:hypothetical protein
VRKMKRRWKLIYRGSCPRTGQEIPLVTSAQWELSDSSKDSDREDPLLGGMRSSDSELP